MRPTDGQETSLLLSSSFVLVLCLLNSSVHVCMSVVVCSLTTVVGNHSLGCLYFAAVALLQSTLSENRLQDVLELLTYISVTEP